MEQLPSYSPNDEDADRWLNEGGHLPDNDTDDMAENDSEIEPPANDTDSQL